jgi:uroporphyrinogen-III decarboxylase
LRHSNTLYANNITAVIETIGLRLADASYDLLYVIDLLIDGNSLEWTNETPSPRMTNAGGLKAIMLGSKNPKKIDEEVENSLKSFRFTNRFILNPVDALHPDTPWKGIERMIRAWKLYR